MGSTEAVCLGTAIVAGVAAGAYKDVGEAVAQVTHEVATVAPSQDVASGYAEQVKQYRAFRADMITHFDFVPHKEKP
jgi:ribulose kinase